MRFVQTKENGFVKAILEEKKPPDYPYQSDITGRTDVHLGGFFNHSTGVFTPAAPPEKTPLELEADAILAAHAVNPSLTTAGDILTVLKARRVI